MWRCYVKYPIAFNVKSEVEYLREKFSDDAFEYIHDALYDRDADPVFYHQQASKFGKGEDCCYKYLKKEITFEEWLEEMKLLDLENYTDDAILFYRRHVCWKKFLEREITFEDWTTEMKACKLASIEYIEDHERERQCCEKFLKKEISLDEFVHQFRTWGMHRFVQEAISMNE